MPLTLQGNRSHNCGFPRAGTSSFLALCFSNHPSSAQGLAES